MIANTPQSQKADVKPISFILNDPGAGSPITETVLYVRPEELTRTDPSRTTVQQTLGGAWGDSFGPGVASINIAGNTGWLTDSAAKDGIRRITDLKTLVIDKWHEGRKRAYQNGTNPNDVQLLFADALDGFLANVVPGQFVLRRSKSRPLLAQYQIPMTVISDITGTYSVAPAPQSSGVVAALGLTSILDSIGKITKFMNGISSWISTNILAPVKAFVATVTKVCNAVVGAVNSVLGIGRSLMSVATTLVQCASKVFQTIAAVVSLPNQIMGQIMGIASAFTNIFCVLKNALTGKSVYQDYTPLFGTSNCSSTAGGFPISAYTNQNAFESVVPMTSAAPGPVAITAPAQVSLAALASMDPVLAPMTPAQLAAMVKAANDGMTVSV
ncbi:hypothetical protein [Paraburkholderia sacchari]|uniref:hypothetical protein n=1 Tax=Paraburkholderia sacchari TaxID=159450 RepID=UPI003D98E1C3